ncbi:MAG: amino acid adenylation domain-containing protein, partial [Psychrosphaera sp.]|nr:amino acid adenylation domain-containing protein [Psychrosphaera sp.]
FTPMHSEQVSAKFELNLVAQSTDKGLSFNLLYNTDLFAPDTIKAMGQHLSTLLRGIVADPNAKLADLPLLSEAQRHYQIDTLNPRKDEAFDQSCIHQRFANHANATPNAIALVMDFEAMTYQALDQQANQLAHYLIEKGVKPGAFVGIALGRSIKMVVAMLAVLKAGAAYVPIDTSYPQHRIDHMIDDSGLTVLLTEQDLDCLEGRPDTPPELPYFNNNQLAHLIYTSGTTGLPKGVMLTHKGTMGLVCRSYGALLNSDTVILQVAAVSFDAATVEIWSALLNGGKLVLLPPGPIDLVVLNTQVTEHQINTLFVTAGLFTLWSMDLPPTSPVKWLLTGGDVVSPAAVARTYQQFADIEVFCCYGPTENSVFTSVFPIPRDFDFSKPLSLGKGLAATHNYILSPEQKLLPLGAVGELYTGGQRLARGYLNLEQTTQQSFIADPFLPGQVMYKTGDYVRMLPDGNLEFAGRVDNQVKIRGFRVEVSEIESQLSQIGASGAVVIVCEDKSGDKHLVAYYTGGVDVDDIRQQLAARVPEFMVPSAFVLLDELPLTLNGKLDRKALPSADIDLGHFVKPQTPMAQRLAQIWAELLSVDVDKISDTADFFALGGHSLLCIRLISQISGQLNIQLGIHDVFNAPQLGQMALLLNASNCLQGRAEIEAAERELVLGEYYQLPMSFAQQRLWFIDQLSGSTQNHMSVALQIDGPFAEARAQAAFERIIERHEPLRTVFVEGVQRIRCEFEFTLASDEQSFDQPFDLAQDLMLRAAFIRQNPQQGILTITLHHIASDGWSMGLLFKEFVHHYQGLTPLPELSVQYADYALWQRNYLAGEVLEQQLGFWQQQLADMPQVHSLPLDFARPALTLYQGGKVSNTLEPAVTEQLIELAKAQKCTLFILIHATVSLVLSRHSNNPDIVLGTPTANRLQKAVDPLIGCFVNTLVLRTDCANNPSFVDILAQVKQTNLDAQDNQDVPFEH